MLSGWDSKKRSVERGLNSLQAPRMVLGDYGYGVLEGHSAENWEGICKKPRGLVGLEV